MKKAVGFFLSFVLICLIGVTTKVHAVELNFAAETQIPSNQIDKKQSYFNLKMKPGQKQTLTIKLHNDTDEAVVINPLIHSATTNMHGVVEYGETATKADKTLPYSLDDLIKVTKEVTVPAKKSVDLKLNVTMPDKPYEGLLAGGVTLEEKKKKTGQKENKGLSIENKYAYVIGITLQESDKEVKQDLKLHEVKAGQTNARNAILFTLQNPTSTYLNRFEIDAKITREGKSETLYKTSQKNMQVAPNSHFTYPVPLNGEALKPGDYTLHLKAKSSKESWQFTKNFQIKRDEANKLNEKDVTLESPNYWWLIALIAAAVVVIGLVIFFIWRHKKKKKKRRAR
ncbi:DUF916 and DUF3324 domain-containing protein [Listeria kieliensis]|uniref:Cell wall anchor protein n=1 Tax=Listeria kieliensis TaxID=1621700 RepID=A0A3D8TQW0_9LIST|nr:DUF916 and DUF3324 domain-containing protein [Listeria kieliensis]RDX01190.1 cell wall anchor protein [Listeria kieliensis]